MLSPTPPPPPKPAMPTWAVILLFLTVLVIAAGTGMLARSLWILPPIDAVSTSPPSSAPVSSGPAFDPTASAALVEMAQAFSTSVAPTVTPLPPTPTRMTPTEVPPLLCGYGTKAGDVCEWPAAPYTPTPTPPTCVTPIPKTECVWKGGR